MVFRACLRCVSEIHACAGFEAVTAYYSQKHYYCFININTGVGFKKSDMYSIKKCES